MENFEWCLMEVLGKSLYEEDEDLNEIAYFDGGK